MSFPRNSQRAALGLLLAGALLCCTSGRPTEGRKSLAPQPAARVRGPAAQSFDRFCRSWMGKLSVRHEHNAKKIAYRKNKGRVVGEYVGYSKTPARCSVKKTGVPANPFVGKLVYYEVRYRKAGKTREAARASRPRALERVEVLELFRFDGKRWVY